MAHRSFPDPSYMGMLLTTSAVCPNTMNKAAGSCQNPNCYKLFQVVGVAIERGRGLQICFHNQRGSLPDHLFGFCRGRCALPTAVFVSGGYFTKDESLFRRFTKRLRKPMS